MKAKKDKNKASQQDLARTQDEIQQWSSYKRSPLEWYNQHIRKEGQKVLTQEEFDERNRLITLSQLGTRIEGKKFVNPVTTKEAFKDETNREQ